MDLEDDLLQIIHFSNETTEAQRGKGAFLWPSIYLWLNKPTLDTSYVSDNVWAARDTKEY